MFPSGFFIDALGDLPLLPPSSSGLPFLPHSNLPLPFLTSQVLCSTFSLFRTLLPFFHSFFLVSEVGTTNKRAHAAFVFLGLGFLPRHGIFQFDSFACEVSDFLFLYR